MRINLFIFESFVLDCNQALGMEDYRIRDDDITASSMYDEYHAPYLGRLNNAKSGDSTGAWSPSANEGIQNCVVQ